MEQTKKGFVTKVLGPKSHTFNIRNAKYAAKYKKMVDANANHIQREYTGGADIMNDGNMLGDGVVQST